MRNTVNVYSNKKENNNETSNSGNRMPMGPNNVNTENNATNNLPSKKLKILYRISIFFIVLIVVVIAIVLAVVQPWKKEKKDPGNGKGIYEGEINYKDYKNELMFNMKVGDLMRICINQLSKEDMQINGIQSELKLYSNRCDDIYIMSENNQENKTLYNKTYKGSIALAGKCISRENEECELKERVNLLNSAKSSNLRNLEKIDDLNNIPIPLCIFNITDDNVIISLSCPESLPENIKEEILSDLNYFRPNFELSPNKKEHYNITNENDIKKLIRESSGLCNLENEMNSFCNLDLNITKNSEGKLLSVNENIFINITTDINNSFKKSKTTKLIDETSKIKNFNPNQYKKILDDFLSKLNPYIKYEENDSIEKLVNQYNGKNKLLISKIKNSRALSENDQIYNTHFSKEEILFYKEILGAKLNLKLRIDSGLNTESIKTFLELYLNEEKFELDNTQEFSNLNDIIKKLLTLSNAGNSIAYQLYEALKNNLNNLTQELTIKISKLNSLVVYKELTEIFDSSLSLNSLKILPFDIIEESNNLFNKLNIKLNELDDENGEFKNNSNLLENSINDYLEERFYILNNTYNDLYYLQTLLKSPKNIFTEISIYHSNNTPTSYVDTIERVNHLYVSYNEIKDKEIKNAMEISLNNFENNFLKSIEKPKKSLDHLYLNLQNNSFTIENARKEDYENIINILKNSDQYTKNIANKIKDKMISIVESIKYELADEIKDKYTMISNDSMDIGSILDNDKIFDKTFNKIMDDFKVNITNLLKYMDTKKEQIFTLNDEVLEKSLFSNIEKRKIKNDISNLGVKIINDIKNENNNYMNRIKENIDKYIEENLGDLNSLILNLNILLSEESLREVSYYYNYEFYSSLNATINTINDIYNLALKYYNAYGTTLESVLEKIEDSSEFTVRSYVKKINQTYFTKYAIFKSNLQKLRNYINNQLHNDFFDEYKNIIVKLKEILLSIKNNKINEIYPGIREFDFYLNHLNNIEEMNKKIDKYFSLELFNRVYLPDLNNFIANYSEIRINAINSFIDSKHNEISKLGILQDDGTGKSDYYFCIEMECEGKYNHFKSCSKYFYDDYIQDTNYSIFVKNNLESRERFEYLEDLIDSNATSYNSKINMIKNSLLSLENDIINEKLTEGYLLPIESKIDLILSEKYNEEILVKAYEYYMNSIKSKYEGIINDINNKWNENFDFLEFEVKNNLPKFKYSIEEFGVIAQIYKDLYLNDIYNKYAESIINLQKFEYNYTVSYYYNYLLGLVNSTYLYTINNIPSNKLQLNTIINLRKDECINKFNKIIKKINDSKNAALNYNNQKNILNFEETNFFNINSILSQQMNEVKNSLQDKVHQISEINNNKQNNEYSITSKLYLENSEFGKQLISIFEEIYDRIYIFLDEEKFKETINNNWIFDQDDIINRINLTLFKNNKDIYKDFLIMKDNFTLSLENEINKYFTKEGIIVKINDLYYEGISSFNSTLMNNFKQNLYPILDKIYEHFEIEAERINTTAVSYTTDFTKINNTIKEYREKIFNKIKSIYKTIIDDFRENMINNFYKDYIESSLNNYIIESKKYTETFSEYNLLNSSYNLREILDDIIENIVKEYKDIVKKQIDYKYQMYLRNIFKLDELEDFLSYEMEMEYTSILYPVLKKKAIFNPGDAGYSEYDLSTDIKNDINSLFDTNMNNIKNIFLSIKGENYGVSLAPQTICQNLMGISYCSEQNNWPILDFSNIYSKLLNIKANFEQFKSTEYSYEKNDLQDNIISIIKSNFNNSLDNIISSYGNDFFERSFKYNEYFKLKDLYNNLKYSIIQTFKYYQSKSNEFNKTNIEYPKELKLKLTNLNNIELLITKNMNYLNESLNAKVSDFINELKDNLINKYISFMESDAFISMSFNQNIRQIINNCLKGIKNEIVNEYVDILNYYLKQKFVNQYINKINEETEEIVNLVNDCRNQLIIEMNDYFTLDSENILEEINSQINKILKAINENNFDSFKISEEIIEYLNNYGEKNIKPIYNEFKSKIDEISKNQIILNFEKNAKNYENSFNLDSFLNTSNNTALSIKENYIDNMELVINDYKSNYSKKFENEIYKENNIINENPLEETFQKIFKDYEDAKIFIKTLNEFNEYDKIISKNINNLNLAFKESKKLIEDSNSDEEDLNNLNNKLYYLNEMSQNYYNKINESFYYIKNYLNDSMEKIYEDINECINITYETLIKEYKSLSKEENKINKNYSEFEEEVNSIKYKSYKIEDTKYYIQTTIKNLNHYSNFIIDVIYEKNDYKYPQILVNITNKNRPKNINFDVHYYHGNCAKKGIILDADLNDVSYVMNLSLNTKSPNIKATTITKFEKFYYTSEVYENVDSEEEICFEIAYIKFCVPPSDCPNKITISKEKLINKEKDSSITNFIKY